MANQSFDWNNVSLESMKGQKWNNFNRNLDELSHNNDLMDDVNYGSLKSSSNGIIRRSNSSSSSDTMKLKQEDMYLFGHCPAWDQFYLVVCEYCGQVIKPQALARHIELRHTPNSFENSIDTPPSSTRSETSVNTSSSNCVHKPSEDSLTTARTLSVKEMATFNNSPKSKVCSVSTPTGPGPGGGAKYPPSNDHTATTVTASITTTTTPATTTANTTSTAVIFKSDNTAKEADSSQTKKSKKANRGKLLPCKDREYDANKHCGVRISDSDKPCTRSLTCKTHSLTLRRNVQGRTKKFDELLLEHRAAKEAAQKAAGLEVKPTKQQLKQKEQEAKKQLLRQQQHHNQQQLSHQQQQQPQQKPQPQERQQQQQQTTNSPIPQFQPPKQQVSLHSRDLDDSRPFKPTIVLHKLTPLHTLFEEPLMQSPVIGQDGNLYLSKHPRPQAICSFNARHLPLKSKKLSSRVFGFRKQVTFSSLDQLIKLASSCQTKPPAQPPPPPPPPLPPPALSACSSVASALLPSLLKSAPSTSKKCKLELSEIRDSFLCVDSTSISGGSTSLLSQNYTTIKTKSSKKKSKVVAAVNNGETGECSSPSSLSSISSPPTPINKSGPQKSTVSSSASSLVSSQVPHKTLNELLSNSTESGSKSILINGNHYNNSAFQAPTKSTIKHFNSMLRLPSSLSFTPSTLPNSAQPSVLKSKHQKLKSPSHNKFLPAKDTS